MDTILTDLCNGNIKVDEAVYSSERYISWDSTIEEKTERLYDVLNDAQKKQLEDLIEHMRSHHYNCEEMFFEEGFKLASRIMAKAFLESD